MFVEGIKKMNEDYKDTLDRIRTGRMLPNKRKEVTYCEIPDDYEDFGNVAGL